jgi:hypothetical protein
MERFQSTGARQFRPRRTSHKEEDDTYVEHVEGVLKSGVTGRDAGKDFVAPQVAFKERALAELVEEMMDFFECPV